MSDKKGGKILRPPRTFVNRSYIKTDQPEVKQYEPEPALVAVPKNPIASPKVTQS